MFKIFGVNFLKTRTLGMARVYLKAAKCESTVFHKVLTCTQNTHSVPFGPEVETSS